MLLTNQRVFDILANKRVLRLEEAVNQSEGVLVNCQCEGNTTKMGC